MKNKNAELLNLKRLVKEYVSVAPCHCDANTTCWKHTFECNLRLMEETATTADSEKPEEITNACDAKCACGTSYSSARYPDGCPTCGTMPLVKLLLRWYYSYRRAISAHKSDDGDKAIKPHFLAVYRMTEDLLGYLRDTERLTDQICSEIYHQVNEKDLKEFEPAVPYKPGEIINVNVDGCEPGFHRINRFDSSLPSPERKLRELLFAEHSCASKYGDDGERQCAECMIDFLRDPVDEIERKIQARNFQRQVKWLKDQNNKPEGE